MTEGEPAKSRPVLAFVAVGAVAAALAAFALWPSNAADRGKDSRLRIVCTFLPMYVFTQNVVGDAPGVDVELLIERDVGCPHSYSLTGRDLKLISRADLVVANGLGAEPFLEKLSRGRDLKILTVSDDCDVLHADPGDHAGHDHEAEDHSAHADDAPAAEEGHEGHDHGDEGRGSAETEHADHAGCELNPHTWVSPREAARQVRTLGRKLAEADPGRADSYRANAETYAKRLEALAQRMETVAKGFVNPNIVTGHAAFDYLARDLGLYVVATLRVIPGETGSAAEMAHVIDRIRETQAAAVFWEPPFGDRVAETVARETGAAVYPLNPFNTDSGLPPANTPEQLRRMYEDVMEQNLATLQKALGTASAPADNS